MAHADPSTDTLVARAIADAATGGPRRVVVAMSGGVDSSVVAALLKRAGHDVVGITLQLYDHGEATGRKGSCCAGQDIHDARRAAEAIGIPHYVLDYEKRFAATVIERFAESYVAGETPVPCVTCNSEIKFHDLLETARELGAEALATGHYIARRDGPDGPGLYRAADAERDQSYFLFATTREQLDHLWFPLGALRKAEVRALARAFALPVADKPDSQDICFVPRGNYAEVIEKLKPGALRPGDIVHADGRHLGRHDGIINFTIGQRKGLGIATGEPLFVLSLDAERNIVVVGPRDFLRTSVLTVRNFNWLGSSDREPGRGEGLDVHARVRSSQRPRPARLFVEGDGRALVEFDGGEDGVAAGQACVLYSDGSPTAQILGGGYIAGTIRGATTDTVKGAATLETRA